MEKRNFTHRTDTLPNFSRLGVGLRVVLIVEAALAFAAAAGARDTPGFAERFIEFSALAQPSLLVSLLLLGLASPRLSALPYRTGALLTLALSLSAVLACGHLLNQALAGPDTWPLSILAAFTLVVGFFTLGYFRLRDRALSPAFDEARLQALQARIRPHFLFNSLNAVLSLVRSDPRRAERALENLSELFRALMGEARRLVPLADEIALTRSYLELEQLRLGERLKVVWHTEKMPADALVPPVLIQPLVENAVYHGIEPASSPGEIQLNVYRSQDKVHIVVRNPLTANASPHQGNQLALDNIRERLLLFFDLDASIKCEPLGADYQVHIVLPYTRHAAHPDR